MNACKNLIKIDSVVLSDFILMKYGPMSHLKLQKLLFYCDAYHLAYFKEELITDKFEAWVHGPVSRKVYNSLRDKSILYADLSFDKNADEVNAEFENLTTDQQSLISDILYVLSKWTGFELETATHKELPWIEARRGYGPADKCNKEISKETTFEFYSKEVNA